MTTRIAVVRDRGTREPAPERSDRVVVEALKRGVLLQEGGIHGSVLSLSPPFVITGDQVDAALGVIEEVPDTDR